MSRENLKIVQESNALSNAGDWNAALELLHPDVEWVVAREHPDARTLVGREAVRGYRQEWQETLPDLRIELDQLLDVDDRVVGVGTVSGTGVGSGADVRVSLAVVFTIRCGLIKRAEEYLNPAEALKAVGLAE
jgi:ketosteroid isomerase-like protein